MFLKCCICFLIFVTTSYTFKINNEIDDNQISNADNNGESTEDAVHTTGTDADDIIQDNADLSGEITEANVCENGESNGLGNEESPVDEDEELDTIEQGSNSTDNEDNISVMNENATETQENASNSKGNEESPTAENDELNTDEQGLIVTEKEDHNSADNEIPAETHEVSNSEEPETPSILNSELSTPRWLQGIVHFQIDGEIYDKTVIARINDAMKAIETSSCVNFSNELPEPLKPGEPGPIQYWLNITNPEKERECVHGIRYGEDGEVIMIIGFDCMEIPDIIHSLMHVLGFNDEVTHPKRNSYVRILWPNIQPKYRHLFKIQDPNLPMDALSEYDTMSIMHFHQRAYTINGAPTIVSAVPGLIINPSKTLSVLDKTKLALAYNKECKRRGILNVFKICEKSMTEKKHH